MMVAAMSIEAMRRYDGLVDWSMGKHPLHTIGMYPGSLNVKHGTPGERTECFVGAMNHHVSAVLQRRRRQILVETYVRPVGFVNQQWNIALMADFCQRGEVSCYAVVIRACDKASPGIWMLPESLFVGFRPDSHANSPLRVDVGIDEDRHKARRTTPPMTDKWASRGL